MQTADPDPPMKNWDLRSLAVRARSPKVLSTTDEARAITLFLPAGEGLDEHQVHERAWVVVVEGELEITAADGTQTSGGTGLLTEFAPSERHAVHAVRDTRLLILLTPWPAAGHPSRVAGSQAT